MIASKSVSAGKDIKNTKPEQAEMERKDRNFYYAHGYVATKQVVKDIELNPLRE